MQAIRAALTISLNERINPLNRPFSILRAYLLAYSLTDSLDLLASIKAFSSGTWGRNASHWLTYNVIGKRPIPYTLTPPFSLTLKLILLLFLAASLASSSAILACNSAIVGSCLPLAGLALVVSTALS